MNLEKRPFQENSEPTDLSHVPCPTCNKPVAWSPHSKWRPFCSERCRLLDLGEWLDENHRISG